MTDAVLSQIEQIIQGIETRTPHLTICAMWAQDVELGFFPPCDCGRYSRVRAEIAHTVERMVHALGEATEWGGFDSAAWWEVVSEVGAAGIRAAGGTPQ